MTTRKTRTALLLAALLCVAAPHTLAQPCGASGMAVQILGAGGTDLSKRAGSSSILWLDGSARLLIDTGGGSTLRFAQSGARADDLDAVLFTNLLADHSADLPALVLSARHAARTRTLPVFGPPGGRGMPSTVGFVRDLFDSTRGAWRHLGEHLAPLAKGVYKLDPHDVRDTPAHLGAAREPRRTLLPVPVGERFKVTALGTAHDSAPALAWRIEAGGKVIVLAGEAGATGLLAPLVQGAQLLVVYDTIDGGKNTNAETLGRFAQNARVGQLIVMHRHGNTAHEETLLASLRKTFSGPVTLADDLACFTP